MKIKNNMKIIYNDDILDHLIFDSRRSTHNFNTTSFDYEIEIHNYFWKTIMSINKKTSNILEYWKMSKTQYFIIALMTKNVLTVSFSKINIERLFNITRNVIIYRCDRLNLDTIETIIMIKYNLSNKRALNENELFFLIMMNFLSTKIFLIFCMIYH